ncbi:hypothetical protein [Streptomyces sp. NPDC000983]|uniref:hypothetical protein n=1 Tax=Streptomyces sp. NPDC000983 TaxID=3154373 RepID=UPI00332D5CAE
MRRARRRRRAAVALAVALAVPQLGGCGIQETDVIAAGGPASFQAFLDREYDMLLFFRAPDGGLSPVIRTTELSHGFGDEYVVVEPGDDATEEPGSGDGSASGGSAQGASGGGSAVNPVGVVGPEKVITALFVGPREEDRAAGLDTALPALRPGGTIEVDRGPGYRVTVRVPLDLTDLDPTALRQLICTVAYTEDGDGRIEVELRGDEDTTSSGTCDLAPGRDRPAGATPSATPD